MSIDITSKVLNESVGKPVLIKLKGDRKIKGILIKFDQHMNMVLKNSVEYSKEDNSVNIGDIMLKGDNIVIISPESDLA